MAADPGSLAVQLADAAVSAADLEAAGDDLFDEANQLVAIVSTIIGNNARKNASKKSEDRRPPRRRVTRN